MMDDTSLSTINVDQLNQAVNNLLSASHASHHAGSMAPTLPQGLTVASLSQLPLTFGTVGNLPQILNILPVGDHKQGLVGQQQQTQTISIAQNINLADQKPIQIAPQPTRPESQQLQSQPSLSALSIPISQLLQAKDLQGATQIMTVQNQNPPIETTTLHGAPQVQQNTQPILQATDFPIISAQSLQQAIQQLASGNLLQQTSQTLPTSVIGGNPNTIYTVLPTLPLQTQQPQTEQTSTPLLVNVIPASTPAAQPTVTPATNTLAQVQVDPITINASCESTGPFDSKLDLQNIQVESEDVITVECAIIQDPATQDKENLNDSQANTTTSADGQSNLSSQHALSVLEMILKSDSPESTEKGLPIVDKKTISFDGIYCVDCNTTYADTCTLHGKEYTVINDTPILSKARMTVPHKLCLKPSGAKESVTGVHTRLKISSRTRFGPLQGVCGEPPKEDDKGHDLVWKVFSDEKCIGVIDVRDETTSNWMRFVQRAKKSKEQNIIMYQQNFEIFFVTTCEIEPGTELLYWFSKDYATLIGVPPSVDDTCRCTICRKLFLSVMELKRHQAYFHADMSTRKWKCQWCPKGFHSCKKLQVHLLGHMGVKPHKCHYCEKTFTDASNLKVHTLLHKGEKNFGCEVCGRRFTQKCHLQSHMVCHTKEKKFKCQYCDAAYGRSSELRTHEYKHTKEKQYTCVECSKVFHSIHNFKRHVKIHSEQKDHPCEMCGKGFITKYHKKRHMKSCKGPTIEVDPEEISSKKELVKVADIS